MWPDRLAQHAISGAHSVSVHTIGSNKVETNPQQTPAMNPQCREQTPNKPIV